MTTPSPRIRASVIARYAAGSIGTGGFGTLPGLVLAIYLTDTLGVAAIWASVIIGTAKLWDVVIDPVIGGRSDRSLAVTGSRRRFMLIGALLLPVFFILTFAVLPGVGPVVAGLWVLVAFVLTATAFSLFQVPYIALPAELVGDYDGRTRLLSARVVVLTIAILLFGAGGPMLVKLFSGTADGTATQSGYLGMAVVAGLLLGLGMLVAVTSAQRGPRADAPPRIPLGRYYRDGVEALRSSRPFRALLLTFLLQALATGMMLAGAAYVAKWVLRDPIDGTTFLFVALIAPALVCAPVWAVISRRTGKEWAFGVASVLFGLAALSLVLLVWIPGPWLYAPVALAGAAYAGMQTLPMAMLPDVISDDATRNGPGRAGVFGGVWTAGETTGMALGAVLLTLVLALTGYQEAFAGQVVEQSANALTGIVLSFSIVPAIMIGVSLWALSRYPLRRGDIDGAVVASAVPVGDITAADTAEETR
ncbi:MFS transporter [Protaetiibacter sp. SSC-01]|uniref:MFS transporter n=1 Tax=Protaetiibacter sp. SSC-01 TaxID=2759943 RepID=UPI0016572548|nr:MFS transporter [Protaetiibacter sp. SSC-01]QNO38261.1 MFS transporter [Protaetiibacter sp. SSC-01]